MTLRRLTDRQSPTSQSGALQMATSVESRMARASLQRHTPAHGHDDQERGDRPRSRWLQRYGDLMRSLRVSGANESFTANSLSFAVAVDDRYVPSMSPSTGLGHMFRCGNNSHAHREHGHRAPRHVVSLMTRPEDDSLVAKEVDDVRTIH